MTRLFPLIVLLFLLPAASVLAGDLPQVQQPNTTSYSAPGVTALTQAMTTLSDALNDYDMASRRYFSANDWSSRDFAMYTAGVLSEKGYDTLLVSGVGWSDDTHTWVLVGIQVGSETAWIPVEAAPEAGHNQQTLGIVPSTTDTSGERWFERNYMSFSSAVKLPSNIPPVAKIRPPAPPIAIDIPVILTALGSYDPDGIIVLYQWEFGDGVRATTTVETVHHTFGDGKTYIVTLTAIDALGKSSTTSLRVRIAGPTDRSPATGSGCGCGG